MEKSNIYIAGHNGLVGSSVVRKLQAEEYINKYTLTKTFCSNAFNLTFENEVDRYFNSERPDYVILAAAKVGGIQANRTYPVDFINNNIKIQTNIINACFKYDIKKLLFLGSSCIYPKACQQPIKEEYLMTGPLEETNKWFALAKLSGIYQCNAYNNQYDKNYVCVMPTNIYGINDNFDKNTSHVLPAMIAKFVEAKLSKKDTIELWGTGTARREFLFSDDLAEALLFVLENFNAGKSTEEGLINIGYGSDVSIKELAETIKEIVGYKGEIIWNTNMPDGTKQKLLDSSKINNLGWQSKTSLEDGIQKTYHWYFNNVR